ncbi:LysR family transcriptional regulator [Luteipulveratus mongoliensis]|nr:LysR family transcriptional regulator [Luteipulveratus mongoliensis]
MRDAVRWFVVLAEEENVTAAAARLQMSQPTLSRMLGRLERRLGVPLFDRHGRRLSLNDTGNRYAEHVRRADRELALAEQVVADLTAEGPRVVRLGFLHSFGTWLVPDLVRRAREHDPSLSFELVQDAADVIRDGVIDGSLDLGILSPQPTSRQVTWRRLMRQSVVLAVPPGHAVETRRGVRVEELEGEAFVSMPPEYGMRQMLDDACAAAGFEPRIVVECQDLHTVAGLVSAGIGVALLPAEQTPRYSAGVATTPLLGAGAGRDVGLVWARHRPLSAPARAVRDIVS